MPFEDFVVADADMHVFEPADLWQRYIAPEYRHAAPIGMTELKRDIRVKVKSQVLLRAGPVNPLKERGGSGIGWRLEQEEAYAAAEARGWDGEAQVDEQTVPHYIDWFGDDILIFSTDFPHGDAQYPNAVDTFRKLPLSEDSQRKIVGDNWSRLYDVPLERKRGRRA